MIEHITAWQKGYDAYMEGKKKTDNPYAPPSPRYLDWEYGYHFALEEHGEREY